MLLLSTVGLTYFRYEVHNLLDKPVFGQFIFEILEQVVFLKLQIARHIFVSFF